MRRFSHLWLPVGVVVCVFGVAGAVSAQGASPTARRANPSLLVEFHGVVEDDQGRALAGAVVSVMGPATVFAVSDRDGRFAFQSPSPGSYLLRAYRQGYLPARSRVIQLTPGSPQSLRISLAVRPDDAGDTPAVLAAGVGAIGATADTPSPVEGTHEQDEVAWRLRRAKRSVLKDAEQAIAELGGGQALDDGDLSGWGRAMGGPARYATALFSDLAVNGEINLLTTTSFDRPQDLFSTVSLPRGAAYMALAVPGASGEWSVRGTMTQGEISSWMLVGAYVRRAPAAHRYEAGLSYSMQRYMGGNVEALTTIGVGGRNVGAVYGYDDWTITPRLRVSYGARYARYGYLTGAGLLSPRAGVRVRPSPDDPLELRLTASHREMAPGAEEFLPPLVGVFLPPERTFSTVSREGFRAERVDHVELGAERQLPSAFVVGIRAFRQRVGDQNVTLFGAAPWRTTAAGLGHYHVGSAGNVDALGWGVSVTRPLTQRLRATVDYTRFDSEWDGRSRDAPALALLARSVLRNHERVHDLTGTIEGAVPSTATRLLLVYKVNTGFAAAAPEEATPSFGTRFDVQVRQALPFIKLTTTQWEMLVAVSNLFRTELAGGSMYDEVLVVRPPTRMMGGVTVRF